MIHYCTYFDLNYLPKAIVLYHSLEATHREFTLWALCLDEYSFEILGKMDLPSLKRIRMDSFERENPSLRSVKNDRDWLGYYYTCSPFLPLHLLQRNPEINSLIYTDADVAFYSNGKVILEELGNGNVLLCEHRFPPSIRTQKEKDAGRFNVGILAFSKNFSARSFLEWWRDRCLEWCLGFEIVPGKLCGDQKYLDRAPELFPGVVISSNPGINLAEWNVTNYKIGGNEILPTVDDKPVVTYHFTRVNRKGPFEYRPTFESLEGEMPSRINDLLYKPYLLALSETERMLESITS